jgi:hypothetical protein
LNQEGFEGERLVQIPLLQKLSRKLLLGSRLGRIEPVLQRARRDRTRPSGCAVRY